MPERITFSVHRHAEDVLAHSIDRPERIRDAIGVLTDAGASRQPAHPPATIRELERVHDRGYLRELRALSRHATPARLDPELWVDQVTWPAATAAAGALIGQVNAALERPQDWHWCLSRPGSHHASRDFAMGFCVINNLAVAAAHALARGIQRVAIIDFDAHHGNGTEAIFADSPNVLTASLHQHPFFPGTGSSSHPGLGIINEPLPADADDAQATAALARIHDATVAFKPQLVLYEAGVDGHQDDPSSDLRLTAAAYADFGRQIRRLRETLRVPMVFELGGGYEHHARTQAHAALLGGLTE